MDSPLRDMEHNHEQNTSSTGCLACMKPKGIERLSEYPLYPEYVAKLNEVIDHLNTHQEKPAKEERKCKNLTCDCLPFSHTKEEKECCFQCCTYFDNHQHADCSITKYGCKCHCHAKEENECNCANHYCPKHGVISHHPGSCFTCEKM